MSSSKTIGDNIHLRKQIETLNARIVDLEDTLERLKHWVEYYPLKIFPEPDMKLAMKALNVVGINLDAVSASAMRHVLTQVTEEINNI